MTDYKKLPPQQIEIDTWNGKFRFFKPDGTTDEETVEDSFARVVKGVFAKDKGPRSKVEKAKKLCLEAMCARQLVPAGRQHAGAGTGRSVTLNNCYVSPTLQDSMRSKLEGSTYLHSSSVGIFDAVSVAAFTQQMGGGIGMDFSTLRPKGAFVKGAGVSSSGPLFFMDTWNAMCQTIRSAGDRRGAMMGTLRCDHPDVLDFIVAKQQPGRLTNFNISVLITDEFMEAVYDDKEWDLGFNVPRLDGKHVEEIVVNSGSGRRSERTTWYVYKRLRARELWDMITRSTYVYAEPGVIFIDRINKTNNLWYCEEIAATNPCGEQPLPPNGACCLGHINLAVLVADAFTTKASVMLDVLTEITKVMVRFLDNVLDVTEYPTPAQKFESIQKRRIGLGITGFGSMLQQLGIRYGSKEALDKTKMIMGAIRNSAYRASIELAKEKGSFPLFDKKKFLKGKFIQKLPYNIKKNIEAHGIRNGVILTVAPTGTTSIYYGNVSSGLEPTFAWSYNRKVRQLDGSFKTYKVEDYGYRLYKNFCENEKIGFDPDDLPDYMVTAQDLTVQEHINMQAVVQEYIDSSVSKTINCPEHTSFEKFQNVYEQAYDLGCKGCTTYRPNEEGNRARGSILSVEEEESKTSEKPAQVELVDRPNVLIGSTYKVKWPGSNHAIYVTINDYEMPDGSWRPFEIFINTKDASHTEWVTALTRSLSAIFRRGGNIAFVPEELQAVHSSVSGAFIEGKYVPSRVAAIGNVLEEHFQNVGILAKPETSAAMVTDPIGDSPKEPENPIGEVCPRCFSPTLVRQEGCDKCLSCGYSNCG